MLLPLINIIVPVIFICIQILGSNKAAIDILLYMVFTLFFGAVLGGIFPILMIIVFNIDTSDCFIARLIALLISAIVCVLSWFDTTGLLIIIVPIALEFITTIFIVKKYLYFDMETSYGIIKLIVITVSNPILLYFGFILDFIISFSNIGNGINIPG